MDSPLDGTVFGVNDFRRHWLLDPDIVFLNHGSFGSCPAVVLEEQRRWRDRMERQPVTFFVRELPGLLDEALASLAGFLGADGEDLAFVSNATSGVNAVLRSLEFREGDELLRTDHTYPACRNAMDYVAARSGARVVVARLPFPGTTPDLAAEAVLAAVTERTKLALIDHVTSPTGLVLPVDRIVRELSARGVDTLVDAAHAPGMRPVDLNRTGAAYTTGNGHKWLCSPKGAAFLHVRRDRRDRIRPAVISHGASVRVAGRPRFRLEFEWTGTDDPTAALSVPAAIRFLGGLLPGGWPELMERNRALALEARRLLAAELGVDAPASDDMIGSLAALPIPGLTPPPPGPARRINDTLPIQDVLWERHRIEVPVFPWPPAGCVLARVSAQLYNDLDDYRALARALRGVS